MKKVIKLTESDLARIVKRVVKEQQTPTPTRPARPANPATPPTGVQLKYTDGKTYPTKLTLINNQQKLNSFLDWGATSRASAVTQYINNGYPNNQTLLNAASGKNTKIDPQSRKEVEMTDNEFESNFRFANLLWNATNLGLEALAKLVANPKADYMPIVMAELDKTLPLQFDMSAYGGKKPSQILSDNFKTAFKNIVTTQLEKVQG